MPGLPFGAVRQRPIPAELQTYDEIAGIEFIEMDADLPYPRSVAYRPTEQGAEMLVRDNAPELERIELTGQQARAYIEALRAAGLFTWQRVYRPAQGTFVVASTQWRLEVSFAKHAGSKRAKPFTVEGENVFPDDYEAVLGALMHPKGTDEAQAAPKVAAGLPAADEES